MLPCIDTVTAAALRGVALTRGRTPAAVAARALGGVYTAAAAAAGLRHATPIAAAPTAIPYAAYVFTFSVLKIKW